MADIVKAIAKEKEYLEYRMKGEEPFHLVDAMRELGYNSLKEYFDEKKEYKFSSLPFELIIKNPDDCIAEGLRLLDTKTVAVVFVDCNETFVYSGESKPFNEEYCKENNIPVYPLYTAGGSIVGASGDLSIGICIPDSLELGEKYMLEKVREILSKYVSSISVDNNDILQDGCKICATTGYKKNGMYLFIAHFSFSDRIDLINEICSVSNASTFSMRRTVPQVTKTPSYIQDVSRDVLKMEVLEWLEVQ